MVKFGFAWVYDKYAKNSSLYDYFAITFLRVLQISTNLNFASFSDKDLVLAKMKNKLDFSKPIIMGILNVTPDSFSDGGIYPSTQSAVDKAMIMIEQGATIIDVGGESTRPGSERVSPVEQKRRIVDVISQLKIAMPQNTIISVDTTSSEVAEAAINLGVGMINDISGGKDDEQMMALVAKHNMYYCIMHMQGSPKNMQDNPSYKDCLLYTSDAADE